MVWKYPISKFNSVAIRKNSFGLKVLKIDCLQNIFPEIFVKLFLLHYTKTKLIRLLSKFCHRIYYSYVGCKFTEFPQIYIPPIHYLDRCFGQLTRMIMFNFFDDFFFMFVFSTYVPNTRKFIVVVVKLGLGQWTLNKGLRGRIIIRSDEVIIKAGGSLNSMMCGEANFFKKGQNETADQQWPRCVYGHVHVVEEVQPQQQIHQTGGGREGGWLRLITWRHEGTWGRQQSSTC